MAKEQLLIINLKEVFEMAFKEFGGYPETEIDAYWNKFKQDYMESITDKWRHNMKNYLITNTTMLLAYTPLRR